MRAIIILAAMAILAVMPVEAQELEDDRFVTEFFGTTAYIVTPEKLEYSELSWWGEALPDELTYDMMFIREIINNMREEKGVTPLLGEYSTMVYTGIEEQVEDGFQYDLTFTDIRPSEARAVLDALGGLDSLFPGGKIKFMPLYIKDFYGNVEGFDAPITVEIASETYEFDPNGTISAIRAELEEILFNLYGDGVYFDLYKYSYIDGSGNRGADLSFYVEIPAG